MRMIATATLYLSVMLWGPAAYSGVEDIEVSGVEFVSSQRINRTVFEYVIRVNLVNPGAALTEVSGTASSTANATTIVESTLDVGNFPNGNLVPDDTITIRHNRRFRFRESNIALSFTGNEEPLNQAPVADAGPDQNVNVGTLVSLDGTGSSDPEGESLSYNWTLNAPVGSNAILSNASTPVTSFTPDIPGLYNATLVVNDGDLDSPPDVVQVEATVSAENSPVIGTSPVTNIGVGESYAYDVNATDADPGDVLAYALQVAPLGMVMDAASGLISWTPSDTGIFDVDLLVTDLTGLTDRQIFQVAVNDGSDDQPPSIDAIANQTVVVGQKLTLSVSGSDPEGENLYFNVVSAPDGVALNGTTGLLEWMPNVDQLGSSELTLSASDPGGLSSSTMFSVTVLAESANMAPTIEPVPDQMVNALSTLNLTLSAVDPDANDILTFGLSGAPAGLQFDTQSASLTWTPGTDDAGTVNLTATVTDSYGATDNANFMVTVLEPPAPPVAVDDAYTVRHRDLLTIPAPGVLENDTDANNDLLVATETSVPTLGTLDAFDGDGSFQYSPPPIPPIEVGLVEQCQTEGLAGSSRSQNVNVADVDRDGNVEILVIGTSANSRSVTLVYDGATCQPKPIGGEWTDLGGNNYGETFSGGQALLVNLDADAELEIVTTYGGGSDFLAEPLGPRARLMAFNLDGSPVWGSNGASEELSSVSLAAGAFSDLLPSAVDLDGDGQIELVVGLNRAGGTFNPGVFAYNASDGSVLWEYISPNLANPISSQAAHWVIADIDLDGTPEILFGDSVLDHNGQLEFRLPQTGDVSYLNMAVVNADNDPFAEIVAIDVDGHTVYEHNGTVKWRNARLSSGPLFGGVTIGELDGDPDAEYVIHEGYLFGDAGTSTTYNLAAFNIEDGSVLWTHENTDFVYTFLASAETSTVPMAFDIDRDGIDELVLNMGNANEPDARRIYILNGDGTERARDDLVSQGDTRENGYLTIADIDQDGAAEVVQKLRIAFDETVRVLEGLAGNPLPPARPLRNQWLSHPTHVAEDGSIPTYIQPQWLIPGLNKFNVATVVPGEDASASDAFSYVANDGNADSKDATVSIAIATVNAPTIVSNPQLGASPGFEYIYPAFATDADFGDSLTWTLVDAPSGMVVSGLGIVSWTPTPGDLGSARVNLVVTDAQGNSDTQDYLINVQPPATVPDILGSEESDANEALEDEGLAVGSVTQNYSLTVPAGQVISQSIAGGQQAGSGAFIDFVISLGPPPIFVPTLANLNTSTAIAELDDIGLALGAIGAINSDTVPKGLIISQSEAPGTQLALGDLVDVVVSSGPALKVRIVDHFVEASTSTALAIDVFDTDGFPVLPLPPLNVIVSGQTGAGGTPPSTTGEVVSTSSDTRGPFDLRVEVPGFGERTVTVIVRESFAADDYHAPIAQLASTIDQATDTLSDLAEALDMGDLVTAQALAQQLVVLRAGIDVEELATRNPFAPEQGFLPTNADASSAGFPSGGSNLGAALGLIDQLEDALSEVNNYVNLLDPARARNDDVRATAINENLQLAVDQLLALNLGVGNQLAVNGQTYALLAQTIPERVAQDIDFILGILADNGIAYNNTRVNEMYAYEGPGKFYEDIRPTFFTLGGMLSATSIRMNIIKNFYANYVARVVSSALVMRDAGILQAEKSPLELTALITAGTTQSFHVFTVPSSIIEGVGFTQVGRAYKVRVVGPDLYQGVVEQIVGAALEPPSTMMDTLELSENIANAASQGSQNGNKDSKVSAVYSGCFFDVNPECAQLVLSGGIPIAHSALPFPAPVLIVVEDLATGQTYSGVYAFFPLLPSEP